MLTRTYPWTMAKAGHRVAYVSGEESVEQVRLRARRLGLDKVAVNLAAETNVRDIIADLILEMDSRLNVTTVTITHDMKVAFKIADRVAMLFQGQIIEEGTPYEFQQSQNPIVQQFIEGRAEGRLTESD